MPSSPLHQRLRQLVGMQFDYLSCTWRLIEVLAEEDKVVLQRLDGTSPSALQANQYGQAMRRYPETLTLPVSSDTEAGGFSDELLLLLQGKKTSPGA
jgi:hypothetical protein